MTTTPTRAIVTNKPLARRRLLRQERTESNLNRPGQKQRARRETMAGYGFLIPWLIGFFGLTLVPMAYSLYLSFTSYNIFSPPKWVGFNNYIRLFTDDPNFIQSAQITLIYVLVGTPITLAAALAVAMLLNYRDKGSGFFRSAFYAPSLIGASVSVAIVWRAMFSTGGPVDNFLSVIGIDLGGWIGNPDLILPMMILLAVWQFGATMVIFLAGLKQIPKELYEAAEMDGAGPANRFRAVTLPMLSPGDLLQPAARPDRRLPGLRLGIHHQQRHRRPRRDDELHHALSLQDGLQRRTDGLRRGDRLGAARGRRDHRLHPLPHSAFVGALLGRQPMTTSSFSEPALTTVEHQLDTVAITTNQPSSGRPRVKRKTWQTVIWFIVLLALAAVVLYPLIWLFFSTFKPNGEFGKPGLLPQAPTIDNYIKVMEGIAGVPMWRFFWNSFVLAGRLGDRHGALVRPGRLRVLAHPVPGPRHHVRGDDRHASAAVPRRDHSPVHPVQQPRPGRHVLAAADPEVPRDRGVLRVPARAVHPADAP